MRSSLVLLLALVVVLVASFVRAAADPVADCEAFLKTFQACVDGLKGEQQDEARVFLKTMRGTLGMADGVNRGDPMMTAVLCSGMIEEIKKDPEMQKYGCKW